jgi:hypothetical protein
MSSREPPVDWQTSGRLGPDPDGLLRAFYRSEMPDPWPAFRRPNDQPRSAVAGPPPAGRTPHHGTAPRARRPRLATAVRGRLALAAAAAVLLLGTLLLAGRFHGSPAELPYDGPPAADKRAHDVIIKESLLQEVEERTGPDGRSVRRDQPTKFMIEYFKP